MYIVINKNNKEQEQEVFPAFIIDDLLEKAKKNSKYYVKPSGDFIEVQKDDVWLLIRKWNENDRNDESTTDNTTT